MVLLGRLVIRFLCFYECVLELKVWKFAVEFWLFIRLIYIVPSSSSTILFIWVCRAVGVGAKIRLVRSMDHSLCPVVFI